MTNNQSKDLGTIIQRQRLLIPLTQRKLASMSGVSASHLGRIERGERRPSAHILRKIAEPLGFREDELMTLAGYLSPKSPAEIERGEEGAPGRLDPYVARVLAQEPVEVQRTVIGILSILKSIAKSSKS